MRMEGKDVIFMGNPGSEPLDVQHSREHTWTEVLLKKVLQTIIFYEHVVRQQSGRG
jgi:hypothetical protein